MFRSTRLTVFTRRPRTVQRVARRPSPGLHVELLEDRNLLSLFGFLIVVLVASSVPVSAGCGRPESATLFKSDCSRFPLGVFSSDWAVVRSISLITEFRLVCST